MGFVDAIKSGYNNYAKFSGRAMRSEYWFFLLFILIAEVVISILGAVLLGELGSILLMIFLVASFLPILGLAVRRLHDIDKSGWYYFVVLIPLVGPILLIVWFCKVGTPGPNQFGPPVG